MTKQLTIDELASFCKSKGFVFKSSEIYGGFAGFWDFGPLGSELMNNIKKDFWSFFVHQKDNMVGIDASIISHPKTWKASGHIANFSDVAVVNKKTKQLIKLDKSEVEDFLKKNPDYVSQGEFNLMFKTNVGALNSSESYLRGETAQGMFLDFNQVFETSRMQIPFGIAQIGRCFRNEIAPRDFLFRSREFHIGEFEFFIHPDEKICPILEKNHKELELNLLDAQTQEKGKDTLKRTSIGKMIQEKRLEEWHAYLLAEQIMWLKRLGLEKIKIREHMKSELSHYSSATFDLDYEYPFGSKEIGGNANRGQYDLTQHSKESSKKLEIFDHSSGKKILPKVIEPTFGIDRIFLALLCNAYDYDEKRKNIVLRIPAFLAPVKVAILPIVKNEEMINLSKQICSKLRKEWKINYDESGSVGRRYSRNDEIGTPLCVTIDEESINNKIVTVRDRDTTKQIKIKIEELEQVIKKVIDGENLLNLGEIVETRVKKD